VNGAHDCGGMHGFDRIVAEADEAVFHHPWEARTFALSSAAPGNWSIDEDRHACENRPPAEYLSLSYYEIWLSTLERLLLKHGFVSTSELASGHANGSPARAGQVLAPGDVESRMMTRRAYDREAAGPPRFSPGQSVRARNINPRGHTRLPRYARGRVGTITKLHGCHPFPDSNAHRRGEDPQWLYGVSFAAPDLWGDDRPSGDTVSMDLFEPYLEAE